MSYNNEVSDAFDLLRNKVIDALDLQWNNGRLSGTDYANAFTQLMNTVIQESVKMPKIEKDIEAEDKQIEKINKDMEVEDKQIEKIDQDILVEKAQEDKMRKDIELENKQIEKINKELEIMNYQKDNLKKQTDKLDKDIDLIERQIKGYDDNLNAKLFTAQLNTWGVMFSSGLLEEKPSIIKNDELSSLYNKLKR